MRANLDGSAVETLLDTSQGDTRPGADGGMIYWTQKGGDDAGEGRIFRADIPKQLWQRALT